MIISTDKILQSQSNVKIQSGESNIAAKTLKMLMVKNEIH